MERPGSGAQARGLRALFRLSRSSGSLVCESSRWHRRRLRFQSDRLDSRLHPGTRVSGRSGTRSARRLGRSQDDPARRARGVPGPCHPIRGETQELDSGHCHRGDLAGNRDGGCSLGRFAFFMNGTGHGFLVDSRVHWLEFPVLVEYPFEGRAVAELVLPGFGRDA